MCILWTMGSSKKDAAAKKTIERTKWPTLLETASLRRMLLHVREILGMTQAEFASAIGVKRQAVARWETQNVLPRPRQVTAIEPLLIASLKQRFYVIEGGPDPTAELLAHIIVLGGRACMSADAWASALSVDVSLLTAAAAGVPQALIAEATLKRDTDTDPFFHGFDVGFALEARLNGGSYKNFVRDEKERFSVVWCMTGEMAVVGRAMHRIEAYELQAAVVRALYRKAGTKAVWKDGRGVEIVTTNEKLVRPSRSAKAKPRLIRGK